MPSMKKFTEFELSQTLITAFSEAVGPTRMNKTTPAERAQLMALANQTAVQVGLIMEGKASPLLVHLPHINRSNEEDDLLP